MVRSEHNKRIIASLSIGIITFVLLYTFVVALFSSHLEPAYATGTLYVKSTGTSSHSCADWSNACNLQTALSKATRGDTIQVAGGVYYPSSTEQPTATFTLVDGVKMYGGFPSSGNPTLADRNWQANPTILSGDSGRNDITHNDIISDTNNIQGTNAYHVVTSSGVTSTTLLDGFIITGGSATGSFPNNNGGGMYNENSSTPTLNNVTFTGNQASNGGGIYNTNSSPILTNVTISNNRAILAAIYSDGGGGGMYNANNSNPTLTNVGINRNTADSHGGGLYNLSSQPILTNVTISGNTTGTGGGGLYNLSSSPRLTNVVITGNKAQDGGGMDNSNSSPRLTNVTMSGNTATVALYSPNSSGRGGGIYNHFNSKTSVQNSIVWGNTDLSGNYQVYNETSAITFTHSLIQGSGGSGNGWKTNLGIDSGNNIDSNPLFISAISGNQAPTTNGNYRVSSTSPAINAGNNTFIPSGVTTDRDGNARIVNGIVDMGAYETYNIPIGPYTISGTVKDNNGAPLPDVTITISNNLQTRTTNSGFYSFTNIFTGTYVLVPTRAGYTFQPVNRLVQVSSHVSQQDFVATPTVTPVITPTVTPTVTPVITPTVTPTVTPVITPTVTPVITPTVTPVILPTASANLFVSTYIRTYILKPGNVVEYNIYYRNSGSSEAANVRISSQLSANLSYVDDTTYPSQKHQITSQHNGNSLMWTIPVLGASESGRIILRARIAETAQVDQEIVHDVAITSDTADPDMTDNQSRSVDKIEPEFYDLAIHTYMSGRPEAGKDVTYFISYWNQGNTPVTGIRITDTLSLHMSFLTGSDGAIVDGTTIAWAVPDVPAYGGRYVQLRVRISSEATPGTALTTSVSIFGNGTDSNTSNNTNTTTTNVVEPSGSISGSVTDPDGNALLTASIQAIGTSAKWWQMRWGWPRNDGTYHIDKLDPGAYRVWFYDWTNAYPDEYYNNAATENDATIVTVAGGQTTQDINAAFNRPVPPKATVDMESGWVSTDPKTGKVRVAIDRSTTRRTPLVIRKEATCANGTPSNVVLRIAYTDGTTTDYTMNQESGTTYVGTIPAENLRPGTMSVVITCSDGQSQEEEIGKIVLFDPSGVITDAVTGEPVVEARVDLYKLPDWTIKSSPKDIAPKKCDTVVTRGDDVKWNDLQDAPLEEGVLANPLSGELDPATNPQQTNKEGRYAWNVAGGCWFVVVSKDGYATRVSPAVGVPPEVTDLDLTLTPDTTAAVASAQFAANAYRVNERNSIITVGVVRTGNTTEEFSVAYTTKDGTATAGVDYTAVTTGTLTFASGETVKSLDVPILNDTTSEDDETFSLILTSRTNNTVLDEATVTIEDDDTGTSLTDKNVVFLPFVQK